MNAINERLVELENKGQPVTVALIGAGQMGQEILCTVERMRGLRIPVVVDITFDRALLAFQMANIPASRVVSTNDPAEARRALAESRFVAATDWQLVPALPEIQAVVDATGSPELGVTIALATITAKKHIIMMNV